MCISSSKIWNFHQVECPTRFKRFGPGDVIHLSSWLQSKKSSHDLRMAFICNVQLSIWTNFSSSMRQTVAPCRGTVNMQCQLGSSYLPGLASVWNIREGKMTSKPIRPSAPLTKVCPDPLEIMSWQIKCLIGYQPLDKRLAKNVIWRKAGMLWWKRSPPRPPSSSCVPQELLSKYNTQGLARYCTGLLP